MQYIGRGVNHHLSPLCSQIRLGHDRDDVTLPALVLPALVPLVRYFPVDYRAAATLAVLGEQILNSGQSWSLHFYY